MYDTKLTTPLAVIRVSTGSDRAVHSHGPFYTIRRAMERTEELTEQHGTILWSYDIVRLRP